MVNHISDGHQTKVSATAHVQEQCQHVLETFEPTNLGTQIFSLVFLWQIVRTCPMYVVRSQKTLLPKSLTLPAYCPGRCTKRVGARSLLGPSLTSNMNSQVVVTLFIVLLLLTVLLPFFGYLNLRATCVSFYCLNSERWSVF